MKLDLRPINKSPVLPIKELMKTQELFLATVVIGIGSSMIACQPLASLSSGGSTAGASGSYDSTTAGPLSMLVTGVWENTKYSTTTGFSIGPANCTVAPGSAPSSTPTSCTVTFPELDLHYSDVTITVGTNSATTCALVSFQPYYYVRSHANNFIPVGATTSEDCSMAGTVSSISNDITCYGGSGPSLMPTTAGPGIPGYNWAPKTQGGVYYLPGASLTSLFTFHSANYQYFTANDVEALFSNVSVSNSLANSSRGAPLTFSGNSPGSVNYAGGSRFVDYNAKCLDAYGNILYQLTLTINQSYQAASVIGLPQAPFGNAGYYDWGN